MSPELATFTLIGGMFGIVALIAILMFVILPKAQQRDRKKEIERSMRQEIVDQNTQRAVARKLLKEVGQK